MKNPAKSPRQSFTPLLRATVALLCVTIVSAPIRLGADCCGGNPPKCPEGSTPKEKETKVKWTLWGGTGHGSATISAKYAKQGIPPPEGFPATAVFDGPVINRCYTKQECGAFNAKDGEPIKLKLSAKGKPCIYEVIRGIFSASWGCSGGVSLKCISPPSTGFLPVFQSCKIDGEMTTGVTNGCSGQSCPIQPTGSGSARNGSVHFEWEMGERLQQASDLAKYPGSPWLPKMLLNLESLAGATMTADLLQIPDNSYLHLVRIIDGNGDFHLLTYHATAAEDVAPFASRTAEFNEWVAENPEVPNPAIDGFRHMQDDQDHPGDERIGLPQCEKMWVGSELRQVRTEGGLAVFKELRDPGVSEALEIRFYYPDQYIVPPDRAPESGLISVDATQIPKYTWRIDRPSASSIRVTEDPYSAANTKSTVWTQVGGAWEMSEDNGNRTESKNIIDIILPNGGGPGTQKTIQIRDAADRVLSNQVSQFDVNHRLVSFSEGVAPDVLTAEYHYPADPLGRIEWMKRSDGDFEKYSYAGDAATLPFTATVLRPWLDKNFDNATPENARVTETLTEETTAGDRVTVTEKIEGQVVSQSIRLSSTTVPSFFAGGFYGNVGSEVLDVIVTQKFARNASGVLVAGAVASRTSFGSGSSSRLNGRLIREKVEDGKHCLF